MTKPAEHNRFIGNTYLVFDYMEHDFVGLNQIRHKLYIYLDLLYLKLG